MQTSPALDGSDADSRRATDSVVAIRKHAASLVQAGLLTQAAAADVQRTLEHALGESRQDRCATIGLVDALLHALDRGLLDPELFVLDRGRQVATFHTGPVLALLVESGLLDQPAVARLKRILAHAEDWFPDSGLSGFQHRVTFARGDRRRGLRLDLARARAFTKCR